LRALQPFGKTRRDESAAVRITLGVPPVLIDDRRQTETAYRELSLQTRFCNPLRVSQSRRREGIVPFLETGRHGGYWGAVGTEVDD
jgi:hypothetical protein